jgi:hypothetical protein
LSRQALDDVALAMQRGDAVRRDILVEKSRLDALLQVFFKQAKSGDVAAGGLYDKLSGRKFSLLGYNAPQSHAVTIAQADAPPPQTSTEYYRSVLDRLQGLSPREIELRDKDADSRTDDESRELKRLQRERRVKVRAEEDAAAED